MLGAAAFSAVLLIPDHPKASGFHRQLVLPLLPDTLFELPIPAPVSALSALVLAIPAGIRSLLTNAVRTKELLNEFRNYPFPDVQGSAADSSSLYRTFPCAPLLIRDISLSICPFCF